MERKLRFNIFKQNMEAVAFMKIIMNTNVDSKVISTARVHH